MKIKESDYQNFLDQLLAQGFNPLTEIIKVFMGGSYLYYVLQPLYVLKLYANYTPLKIDGDLSLIRLLKGNANIEIIKYTDYINDVYETMED